MVGEARIGEGLAYLDALKEWGGTKDFNLENIKEVMGALGNPQNIPRSVHVAGTNGKGSVCAAISSILGQTGVSVGLNTSPHLVSSRERFIIDGRIMSDDRLASSALKVKEICETLDIKLSFHEGCTAISFVAFSDLEWIVMEVGLGGRLDSSNVMNKPTVSAITTIDLDHQHILGDRVEDIAAEKAGIVKERSTLVVGNVSQAAFNVISRVSKVQNAELVSYGNDFSCRKVSGHGGLYEFLWKGAEQFFYRPALLGVHQAENMAVAAAMAKTLGISDDLTRRGTENTNWPGRLEKISGISREVFLDCAHNAAGMKALMSFLECDKPEGVDMAFGVLDTKNWTEMVDMLFPYVRRWFLLRPASARAVPTERILNYLSNRGATVVNYDRDYHGFIEREVIRKDSITLLAAGSIYFIGKLRGLLVDGNEPYWKRESFSSVGNL